MSRLARWWRRVFGEPAPLEYSAQVKHAHAAELSPERQAVIDDLTRRQHAQANTITAETGKAYVTRQRVKRMADQVAVYQRNVRAKEDP
jgi:hypothetical protein